MIIGFGIFIRFLFSITIFVFSSPNFHPSLTDIFFIKESNQVVSNHSSKSSDNNSTTSLDINNLEKSKANLLEEVNESNESPLSNDKTSSGMYDFSL